MKDKPIKIITFKDYSLKFYKNANFSPWFDRLSCVFPETTGKTVHVISIMLTHDGEETGTTMDVTINDFEDTWDTVLYLLRAVKEIREYLGYSDTKAI